ncbi:hypothetical protein GCM10010358_32580 [Streptomyces minutiscleroticus]|uniref:Uncharacterized protein n=1 Tax=Streptomyces minutiscleroticus TaxID=68238 RepID=A0A918KTS3_9ACTN|nr:hypothetical protein GCM10010358_32580 [Streptomyces minutiscleroticus]
MACEGPSHGAGCPVHPPAVPGHTETAGPAGGGRLPDDRRWTVTWWMWLVVVFVALVVVGALALGVQARRRSGTVIAVRRGRPGGRGAA